MSVSLVLVPLAFAALSAYQAARASADDEGRTVCHVGTRMVDERLLGHALADTGAQVVEDQGRLVARWQGVDATFARDDQGVWQVDLTGEVTPESAAQVVAAVDAAYAARVQQEVLARIRERAHTAGMAVELERVEEDRSVTLVLTVGAAG
ncbi:hypothetical protein [Nocardioides caldifontis]|uniref:hypothetical protein n=1 Tax=Nocardioides caldifontis TaxID=2588938 RepID=UPI0011E056DC|nr:hypothetical protein [Nocardioides caldifontis]